MYAGALRVCARACGLQSRILRRNSSGSVGDLPDAVPDDAGEEETTVPIMRTRSLGAPTRVSLAASASGGAFRYPRGSDVDVASLVGTPRTTLAGDAGAAAGGGFSNVPPITDADAEALLQEFLQVNNLHEDDRGEWAESVAPIAYHLFDVDGEGQGAAVGGLAATGCVALAV